MIPGGASRSPLHMNGRIYSPSIGRMLSPDPVTQEPENGQNYNRYTYAFNNPLKYTDPSGYCVELGSPCGVDSWNYTSGTREILDSLFEAARQEAQAEARGNALQSIANRGFPVNNGSIAVSPTPGPPLSAGAPPPLPSSGDIARDDVVESVDVASGGISLTFAQGVQLLVGTVETVGGAMACTTLAGCAAGGPLAALGVRNVIEATQQQDILVVGLERAGFDALTAETTAIVFDFGLVVAGASPAFVSAIADGATRAEAAWQIFLIYAGLQGVAYDIGNMVDTPTDSGEIQADLN